MNKIYKMLTSGDIIEITLALEILKAQKTQDELVDIICKNYNKIRSYNFYPKISINDIHIAPSSIYERGYTTIRGNVGSDILWSSCEIKITYE